MYKPLDSRLIMVYDYVMVSLTIKQIKSILDISYPTALIIANESGEMINGRWFVPVEVVAREIDKRSLAVEKMKQRLELQLDVQVL